MSLEPPPLQLPPSQSAADGFGPYTESVKVLSGHLVELRRQLQDTYSKAGLVGQALVELTDEEGGDLALKATGVRSVIARIQVRLFVRFS